MLRKIFPAPLLSLALAALWLVLNRDYGLGQWLLAALLGVAVPVLTKPLRPTPVSFRRPWAAWRLFWRVGGDVVVWNWRVLRGTLAPSPPRGTFVTVPLDLRDPNGLAVLAAIMCVIPGTVWSELALDRSALLVHMFDLRGDHDPQAEIDLIKSRYEKPLMEIFE